MSIRCHPKQKSTAFNSFKWHFTAIIFKKEKKLSDPTPSHSMSSVKSMTIRNATLLFPHLLFAKQTLTKRNNLMNVVLSEKINYRTYWMK